MMNMHLPKKTVILCSVLALTLTTSLFGFVSANNQQLRGGATGNNLVRSVEASSASASIFSSSTVDEDGAGNRALGPKRMKKNKNSKKQKSTKKKSKSAKKTDAPTAAPTEEVTIQQKTDPPTDPPGVCEDTEKSFEIKRKGDKDCDWAGKNKAKRCKGKLEGGGRVKDLCPVTCDACPETPSPTDSPVPNPSSFVVIDSSGFPGDTDENQVALDFQATFARVLEITEEDTRRSRALSPASTTKVVAVPASADSDSDSEFEVTATATVVVCKDDDANADTKCFVITVTITAKDGYGDTALDQAEALAAEAAEAVEDGSFFDELLSEDPAYSSVTVTVAGSPTSSPTASPTNSPSSSYYPSNAPSDVPTDSYEPTL